jgi:hypothetical protein
MPSIKHDDTRQPCISGVGEISGGRDIVIQTGFQTVAKRAWGTKD